MHWPHSVAGSLGRWEDGQRRREKKVDFLHGLKED